MYNSNSLVTAVAKFVTFCYLIHMQISHSASFQIPDVWLHIYSISIKFHIYFSLSTLHIILEDQYLYNKYIFNSLFAVVNSGEMRTVFSHIKM
jgi:hypothetical protein